MKNSPRKKYLNFSSLKSVAPKKYLKIYISMYFFKKRENGNGLNNSWNFRDFGVSLEFSRKFWKWIHALRKIFIVYMCKVKKYSKNTFSRFWCGTTFFHVSDKKCTGKMYRKKMISQVCPYFYILAKWSANYGYEFFDFAHNISGLKNIVRYYIYKLFADSWELSQWSTSFLTLGWCIRKEKRQNFKKYAL